MLFSEEHYLDVKLCHVDRTKNILGVAGKDICCIEGSFSLNLPNNIFGVAVWKHF